MTPLDAFAVSAFVFTLVLYVNKRRKALPLPPGPKRLPLIGNLLDLPKALEWEVYNNWCKDLDTDVLYLNAAGTHIVILNTYQAAMDLLEKKSSLFSGRPRLPMVNELMGYDYNFGFMDYGDRWRSLRRLMHHSFHPTAALRFRVHELKAARSLLRRLLDEQDDLLGNLRLLSGEAILSTTYGLDIKSKHDKYIMLAEESIDPVVPALIPGAFLVDVFPALKYVPSWFPGAGFKRKAHEWKRLALAVKDVPYVAAKQEINKGSAPPCFCMDGLNKLDERLDVDQQEESIKDAAGTLFGAGADSTMAAVATCIIALINHPEVLRRAQEEVDRVLLPGHLPDFGDYDSLPYITAIMKESMRWRPTAPLALPHLAHADEEYNGYLIPKGSIVMANSWAMLHDERYYPDPHAFKPERFLTKDGKLDPSVRNPDHAFWGFGRRICPGRYMATSSMWITIASLITAFDFSRCDESGGLDHPYGPGGLRVPRPFKCNIIPRSKKVEEAIRATSLDEYRYKY